MKKLLVVDDEDKIREVIKEYAEFSGYEVTEAADGMSAIGLCKLNDYDLIIMDVMMPKLDGFSSVKEIKKIKDIPVIMLSARGEEYDKLFGFELGIDDYVVKPFSPKELMARVNAVLQRKSGADNNNAQVMKFDGLEVNFAARTISVDGERVNLTPKEYDLLFYLIQNKNIALSRDKLLSDIWGYDFFGDDRTIDTHIKNLRNNLGPYRNFIVTLRGVGYKFEYDDTKKERTTE
jgi:two-component system, OmpR family, response regulator ResD